MNAGDRAVILLVEDNEDDVFAMTRALRMAKVMNPVQVAKDGQQALDYLAGEGLFQDRARHPLPFIVFLDLKLPFVHGFEVLSWMKRRAELEPVVVVVLTSSDEPRDHQTAYALGARSYLVKPPTAQGLTDVLTTLGTFWLSRDGATPVLWETSANG